jgi:hypothetical protein
MRLILPIPPDWPPRKVGDGVLHLSPVGTFGMMVMPLTATHEDPETWVEQALVLRDRDGKTARNTKMSRLVTEAGWVATLLEGEVGVEARLVAYFMFFDYAATVIAVCRDPAQRPSWRDEALAILAGARPDFSQEGVVCLAQQLGAPPPLVGRRPVDPDGDGWRRLSVGGDMVLAAEAGPRVGRIRVVHRVCPVRPVDEVFAPLLAAAGPAATIERPAVIVTLEGEYAAIASVADGARQETLGVIFGDEHMAQIHGLVTAPEQFRRFRAAVHKLTFGYTMGLGTNRWRRYYYTPPAGWTGVARGRDTLWISPRCPREYQIMKIFDARPPGDSLAARQGARLYETLPQEFFVEPPIGPIEFETRGGLRCQVIVFSGRVPNRPATIKAIEGTAADSRYIYPLRLECDEHLYAETMNTFERVIESIKTFPDRGPALDPDLGVLTSWSD